MLSAPHTRPVGTGPTSLGNLPLNVHYTFKGKCKNRCRYPNCRRSRDLCFRSHVLSMVGDGVVPPNCEPTTGFTKGLVNRPFSARTFVRQFYLKLTITNSIFGSLSLHHRPNPQELIVMRTFISAVALAVVVQSCTADDAVDPFDPFDPFDVLFDTLTTCKSPDGSVIAPEAETPRLWRNSRYLIEDGGKKRLLRDLKSFDALSSEKVAAYSPLQRAILQHHLWCVFDWTTIPAGPVSNANFDPLESRISPYELRQLQKTLASSIRKLAMTRQEILSLPSPLQATVAASVYSTAVDENDAMKPFLPEDLLDSEESWVCINRPDYAVPATLHAEANSFRSAFLIFLRLPGARQQTINYLAKLNAFGKPWLPGKQKPAVNIPVHADLRGLELHANPQTPNFPAGTQVALVKQALLIDDSNELVLSPLIQSIQLRAYLNVSIDSRLNNPVIGPSQAVAEFVLQPRQMMAGGTPMRAISSRQVRHTNTFEHSDPFDNREGEQRVFPSQIADVHGLSSRRRHRFHQHPQTALSS